MESKENIGQIENLIFEYNEQRLKLKEMIVDLEKLKNNIEKIFPSTLDNRYIKFFDEKIKTTTELFKALLDIRREISKNLKDEIEFRMKFQKLEVDSEGEEENINKIAMDIERLRKNNIKLIKEN